MDKIIERESMNLHKIIKLFIKTNWPMISLSLHHRDQEGAGPYAVIQKEKFLDFIMYKKSVVRRSLPMFPGISERNVGLKFIFYVGFFLLQSTLIFSMQDEEKFVQGNQLFMQGSYVQACDIYKSIENKGFVVLYNIAISYVYQGNLAQVIMYAKRAKKQANFQQLTKLYELFDAINRQANPDYEPSWYDQFTIFLKKCILSISMLLVQILLFILLVVLMIYWYRRRYKTNVKSFLWIAFFCMIFLSLWWYKTSMMQEKIGVVTKNLISVFAGPDESFYKKSELHESDEVIILSSQQGYYQIRAKKVIGWIHDNDIELV